jgi:uncharacterized protein (TIGR03437 family)
MRKTLVTASFVVLSALAGSVAAQAQATVGDNAVVDAANPFNHSTAPGSIVSIFGTNFASGVNISSTVPLSTSLGGTSVTFNNLPAPLFFTSSGQINAQLPSGLSGTTASVVVTTPSGPSAPKTIQIAPVAPAIFSLNAQGSGQGAVLFANSATFAAPVGSIPGATSQPAKAGDVLTIYANSLGPVDPPVADGNNTLDGLRNTRTKASVILGGVMLPDANVLFSGLAPQFVALYQVNLIVPSGIPAGNAVPIQISIGGMTSSDKITIALQ